MQKVKIFMANGVIMTSTPMVPAEATEFINGFKAHPDYVDHERVLMSKDESQERFRNAAIEWRTFAERNRADKPNYDRNKDVLAVTLIQECMQLGCSG